MQYQRGTTYVVVVVLARQFHCLGTYTIVYKLDGLPVLPVMQMLYSNRMMSAGISAGMG